MIFYEYSCDRLYLLDFNKWNCLILLCGAIKLIIVIVIAIIIVIIIITITTTIKVSFAILRSALICLRGSRTVKRNRNIDIYDMDFQVENSRTAI